MESFKSLLLASITGRKAAPPSSNVQDIERGQPQPASSPFQAGPVGDGELPNRLVVPSGLKRMPGGYLSEEPLPKVRIVTQEDRNRSNFVRLTTQRREIKALLNQLEETDEKINELKTERPNLNAEHQQTVHQLRSEVEQSAQLIQVLRQERDALLVLERLNQADNAEESAKPSSSQVGVDKETQEQLQALLQERDLQLANGREQLREAMKRAEEAEERAEASKRLIAEANERAEANRRLLVEADERAEVERQFLPNANERAEAECHCHAGLVIPAPRLEVASQDEASSQPAETGKRLPRSRGPVSSVTTNDHKTYSERSISGASFMAVDPPLGQNQATSVEVNNQLLNINGQTPFFERPFVLPPLRFPLPKSGTGPVLHRNVQIGPPRSSLHERGNTSAGGLQHAAKSQDRNAISTSSQSSLYSSRKGLNTPPHSPIPHYPDPQTQRGLATTGSALVSLSLRSGLGTRSPGCLPATRSPTPRSSPLVPTRSPTPITPRRKLETPRVHLPEFIGPIRNSTTPSGSPPNVSSRGQSRSSIIDSPNSSSIEVSGDGRKTTPASAALSIDDSSSDAAGAVTESDSDDLVGHRLANVERKLDQLIDEMHQNEQIRPGPTTQRKSPPGQRFRRGPARTRDARRTTVLGIVRKAMNNALGIKRDAGIINVRLATEDEVAAYEEDGQGAAVQPSLNPMHPDLQNPWSCWNASLWDLLILELLDLYNIDSDTLDEMKEAFHQRLVRLSRKLKLEGELGTGDDSEVEEHAQSRQEKELRNKHLQRVGTRRRTLFSIRKEITETNCLNSGVHDWDALDKAVAVLHHEGMSSDESGTDDNQHKVYFVKKVPWRAKSVTDLLRHLDEDRNVRNGFGGRRPGNPPRTRIITRRANVSDRQAPPCLPVNFYDSRWYKNLSHRDRQELNPRAPMDLPLVDDLKYQ